MFAGLFINSYPHFTFIKSVTFSPLNISLKSFSSFRSSDYLWMVWNQVYFRIMFITENKSSFKRKLCTLVRYMNTHLDHKRFWKVQQKNHLKAEIRQLCLFVLARLLMYYEAKLTFLILGCWWWIDIFFRTDSWSGEPDSFSDYRWYYLRCADEHTFVM